MGIPVVEQRRFMVGKYEIVARPIPGSAHMLRYAILLGGKHIGAMASVPTESDCRFLEKPPVIPPLKIFSVTNRPGRPKKGSRPPQPADSSNGMRREPLPPDVSFGMRLSDDR
jgi:hypothetical protein